MINYTWNIKQLERNIVDGGVITAHWEAIGTQNVYTAVVRNTCSFTPNPADTDFIPYDELTEATVLGWVWEQVGKTDIESIISTKLDAQINPQTESGTPW